MYGVYDWVIFMFCSTSIKIVGPALFLVKIDTFLESQKKKKNCYFLMGPSNIVVLGLGGSKYKGFRFLGPSYSTQKGLEPLSHQWNELFQCHWVALENVLKIYLHLRYQLNRPNTCRDKRSKNHSVPKSMVTLATKWRHRMYGVFIGFMVFIMQSLG